MTTPTFEQELITLREKFHQDFSDFIAEVEGKEKTPDLTTRYLQTIGRLRADYINKLEDIYQRHQRKLPDEILSVIKKLAFDRGLNSSCKDS